MNTTPPRHDRYPGVRPFADSEADQRVFFGRGREIHELFHQIRTTNLLVLFGKSGLGKTSLLQAGLFPLLRQFDLLPLPVRLNDTQRPPLELFFEDIAEQCRRDNIDYTPGATTSLWEFYKTALFLHGEALQTPVLVLDQFEELFTLQDQARRAAMVHELAELTSGRLPEQFRARRRAGEQLPYSDRPPEVKVILSLREDFLGALQELTRELPTILEQRFRLTEFDEKQARTALEGPAQIEDAQVFRTQAFHYTEDVVEQVLTFLKGRTGLIEPFQLQVLCQYVEQRVHEEQARGQKHIQVDQGYLGNTRSMEAILQNFYQDVIRRIPSWWQRNRARLLCEEGLLNRQGLRLSLEEHQIIDTYRVHPEMLNTLVDARLLRKEPRLESFYYEISHDSLAQPVVNSRRFRLPKRVLYGGVGLLTAVALGIFILQQQWHHEKELAVLRAQDAEQGEQFAKAQKEQAEAAAEKARRARAEAERLLGFLLFDLRDKLEPIGRLDVMADVQKQVNRYYERMEVSEEDTELLRQRSVAFTNQGNILSDQGNLQGALQAYQNGLAIDRKLAAADPSNTTWQRDLSVSFNKVGDVFQEQGQLAEALKAYQDGLAIAQKLAAADPSNTTWQRDLSVSFNKVGEVFQAQGQLAEALKAYQDGLAIAQKLAAADPSNTTWQIDLVVSFWKTSSSIHVTTEFDKQGAQDKLNRALDILRRLDEQGRLAPRYQQWIGTIEKRLESLSTPGDRR